MHHREAVDQHGHVVTVGEGTTRFTALVDGVLVEYLQSVVVDVLLVDQRDVLGRAVVPGQQLDVVFLDADGFLDDAVVLARDPLVEEAVPLGVREGHLVERFELGAQVRDQVSLRREGQALIRLRLEQGDELLLQCHLGLVARAVAWLRNVLRDDRALSTDRNRVEIRALRHHVAPSHLNTLRNSRNSPLKASMYSSEIDDESRSENRSWLYKFKILVKTSASGPVRRLPQPPV